MLQNTLNSLDVACWIVEKGAPIDEIKYANDPESYYGTSLHRAAECGKVDIVKYLLELGADPLKLDSKGRMPRFWAEQKGSAERVRILKEAEKSRHA